MCGRYVRRGDKQKLAEHFRAQPNPPDLPIPDADYNVAPTKHQPIIRQSRETGDRELVLARWGLIPYFTKDLSDIKGLTTINARAETITTAPTWREPFKKRRCLVPLDPKEGKPPKQPYAFELLSGGTFAFAGLWDAWKDAQGHWLQSFAIVTTEANGLMASIHPRMPVIPALTRLRSLAGSGRDGALAARSAAALRVGRDGSARSQSKVGNIRKNGPEMMRAAALAAEGGELPL